MEVSSRPGDRLAFLDVARAVAAGLVVLAHGLHQCVPGSLDWCLANLEPGRAGVVSFLLISGFVIPPSLERTSQGRFWLRRLFRLWPAYWLSIAAASAYLAFAGPSPALPDDPRAWAANLTMLQGFFGVRDVWDVFWTLRLELLVYASCSALAACGLLSRVGLRAGVALLLLYFAFAMSRPLRGKPFPYHEPWLLYLAPLMGLIARRYWEGRVGRRPFYAFVVAQPAALVCVWAAHLLWLPDHANTPLLWTMLCNWGLAYVCFLGLLELRHRRMPAAVAWAGRVSYPVYLLHPLVLLLLAPLALPAWAHLPALFALSLLLATLAHSAVETPGIALGRSAEGWLFPAKRPALPAAHEAQVVFGEAGHR